MAARKPPKNGRPWTPQKVRERIRIGLIASRLEKHALGQLKEDAKRAIDRPMSDNGIKAAIALFDRCIPRAQATQDVTHSGTIIVQERDPTQRPDGYQRRRNVSV